MAPKRDRYVKGDREFPTGLSIREHAVRRHSRDSPEIRWWMAFDDPSDRPFEDCPCAFED